MIRPYRAGDEIAIAALEKECFSKPWSKEAIINSAAEGVKFFVCEENDSIVGYAGLQTVLDEGYITNIAVTAPFRRKGIGKLLLDAIDEVAEELSLSFVSLEVRQSNIPAISLYTLYGYESQGVRKKFYTSPNEDAVIMKKVMRNNPVSPQNL